jgi:hypothetical protein
MGMLLAPLRLRMRSSGAQSATDAVIFQVRLFRALNPTSVLRLAPPAGPASPAWYYWVQLMDHDIFISHSSKDKATAEAVLSALESAGICCWIAPRDVPLTVEYGEAIISGIAGCKLMMLIFSSSANRSPQVRREVERAVSRGKALFTLRVEDVLPSGSMEYFISAPHWLDAGVPPLEQHLGRLVQEVRSLLSGMGMIPMVARSSAVRPLDDDAGGANPVPNPFVWRNRIFDVNDIFDREGETRQLADYIRGRQNCQIVGPKRIGKSSLLRRVEVEAPQWSAGAVVAYLDLSDPACFTMSGVLSHAGRELGSSPVPDTLTAFSQAMRGLHARQAHPILCFDDFDELLARKDEFPRDFFQTLRSLGQRHVSIIVTSCTRLSELSEVGDPCSPFYNIVPMLKLDAFTPDAASDFVTVMRPGIPPFSNAEKRAILDFSRGHPMALQVACHALVRQSDRKKVG